MSQRSLDTCGVSVADLVKRLNEPVGIVAQLRHHGIRLIDKLDDCAARISTKSPAGNASGQCSARMAM